jgi:hypothetical protein
MNCPRCNTPIAPTEPTATMTTQGHALTMHAACGRAWHAEVRTCHLATLRYADRLRKEMDSMRIVPADEDGVQFNDVGELVSWAH